MSDTDNIDLAHLDYVVKVPYNGSGETGGNPLEDNLNIWYEVRVTRELKKQQHQ
jgi:hypothetical protein